MNTITWLGYWVFAQWLKITKKWIIFISKLASIAPVESNMDFFVQTFSVKVELEFETFWVIFKHCVLVQYVIDRKLLFYSWVHRKKIRPNCLIINSSPKLRKERDEVDWDSCNGSSWAGVISLESYRGHRCAGRSVSASRLMLLLLLLS